MAKINVRAKTTHSLKHENIVTKTREKHQNDKAKQYSR